MNRIRNSILCLALLSLLTSPGYAQGVVRPILGWRPGVDVVGAATVPVDDAHRWHVAVFADAGPQSARLARDFNSNPKLRTWLDPGRFNFNWHARSSINAALFREYQASALPLVVVHPPKGGAYPYKYVYRAHGYDGDADGLAESMRKYAQAFVDRFAVAGSNCPGPFCPTPQPTPQPQVQPEPEPYSPIPDFPDDPDAYEPDSDEPAPGDYPHEPWITVVYDATALNEAEQERELTRYALVYASFHKVTGAKLRRLEWQEACEQYPFLRQSQTPAAVITNQGRHVATVDGSVLDALVEAEVGPPPPVPVDPPTPDCPTCPVPDVSADVRVIQQQIIEIRAIIGKLQLTAGQPGPKGDRGEPGPAGPPGPAAELDYEQLAAEVAKRLPPVRVELTRDDGTVFQSLEAPLNGQSAIRLPPIRLRAKPRDGAPGDAHSAALGEVLNVEAGVMLLKVPKQAKVVSP